MSALEEKTTLTLANATTLATNVIMRVAGNAVSNQIDNAPITPVILNQLVLAKIQKQFAPLVGA